MKLELKHIDIGKVITFLEKTNFKGLQSVNRTRVTNYLTEQLQHVAEGEKTIREDFKGDEKKLKEELEEYFEQIITVEGVNFKPGLTAIKNKIKELTNEESEQEFSDEDAYALFILYEAFNLGGEDDEDND